jgi:hypothetical protein
MDKSLSYRSYVCIVGTLGRQFDRIINKCFQKGFFPVFDTEQQAKDNV